MGVVDPGAAERDGASDPLLVYLSGYEQADRMDRGEDFDQRSVCYIATDRRADYAWRANIYIERYIFRRIVELYASRRIEFGKDFGPAESAAQFFRGRRSPRV